MDEEDLCHRFLLRFLVLEVKVVEVEQQHMRLILHRMVTVVEEVEISKLMRRIKRINENH